MKYLDITMIILAGGSAYFFFHQWNGYRQLKKRGRKKYEKVLEEQEFMKTINEDKNLSEDEKYTAMISMIQKNQIWWKRNY